MANIPQPRSYQQILGSMLSSVLSSTGLASVKVGGPLLSVLEAAAQSDFRSSEDTFNSLQSVSLDTSEGDALDNIGAQEKVPRPGPTFASGIVTFTDTNFTKIFSNVYPGTPAVPIGSTSINVSSAGLFPPAGSIYIGRGTPDLEGPITYTSITPQTGISGFINYYTLSLAAPTQFFHNINETVILSQGGVRPIGAGSVVAVPQGTNPQTTNYTTLYPTYIPDGETFASNIAIVCQIPGSIGNAAAGNITQIVTPLFNGCTVTNPTPLSNGQDSLNDTDYRELIRQARQTRAKGTDLAITTGVVGITSPSENKTIVSSSLVSSTTPTETLYIDDGTGYEEVDMGIAFEAVVNPALGGENTFHLASQPPVAKAEVFSQSAPFALSAGATLSATIGGITSSHTFQTSSFNSISNATSFEVVSSINSDPNINFGARTANNASQVVLFALQDTNESITVVPSFGNDANLSLGFPTSRADTLRLYKNDVLLYKDGFTANITTNSIGQWANTIGATGQETLIIAIDGTPAQTYTFTSLNFINGNTGYIKVGKNSLQAWVTVFNQAIPGITAQIVGGSINIVSNSGATLRSSIVVNSSSTLVINSMFNAGDLSSFGTNDDYTLNRNTGELQLTKNLVLNDILTAGSFNTEGYVGGTPVLPNTVYGISLPAQTGPNIPAPYWWIAVDGQTQTIPVQGITTVIVSQPYGYLVSPLTGILNSNPMIRLTVPTSGTFANVLPGDWMIAWDTGLTVPAIGASFLSGSFTTANGTQSWTGATTTFNVTSTAGFPLSGTFYINLTSSWLSVPYTGISGNTFTGCTFGGSGTITNLSVVSGSSTLGTPGAFRISAVDTINGAYIEFKSPYIVNYPGANTLNLSLQQGLVFCRTASEVQTITIPPTTFGNNYTLDTLATAFNNVLIGAFAVNFNNQTLRIATDTTYTNGDIMIVTANQIAQSGITFPLEKLITSSPPHLPFIESQNSSLGTPGFLWDYILYGEPIIENDQFTTALHVVPANAEIAFIRPFESPFIQGAYAFNSGTMTITASIVGAFTKYVTGQYVYMSSALGSTFFGINGPITVVSSSQITFPFGGSGSGTGYVQNFIPPMDVTVLANNGSVTTVTTSTAHGLLSGLTVRIFNSANPLYNGTFGPITVTSTTTFTYAQVKLGGLSTVNQAGTGIAIGIVIANSAYSTNSGDFSQNSVATGQTVIPRLDNSIIPPTVFDRIFTANPYSIGPNDNLALVLDGSSGKNFNVNLYRNVGPVANSLYGSTLNLIDLDNSASPGAPVSSAFGNMFNFDDYALYMNGRGKSHDGTYAMPSTNTGYYYNKGAIWRYQRMGPEGNDVTLQYIYPNAANQPVGLTTVNNTNGQINLEISLPAGSARSSTNISANTNFSMSPSTFSSPITALTVVSTTATVTLSGSPLIANYLPGDVMTLSGLNGTTVGLNGNSFLVTGSSSSIVSGAYQEVVTITVPNTTSASGVTSGAAFRGRSLTYVAGFDLPIGTLQSPAYTISSIVGGGSTVTVTITPPAYSSGASIVTETGLTTVTYASWNVTGTSATFGNTGTVLAAAFSTGGANPTSQIKITGTGVGAWDGNTFTITGVSLSGSNIQLTFANSTATSSASGSCQPNTVVANPTLPMGTIYSLVETFLSPSSNGQFLTITPAVGGTIDTNYPPGTKYVFGLSNLTFSYVDSSPPASTTSIRSYTGVLQNANSFMSPGAPILSASFSPITLAGNVQVGDIVNINPALSTASTWPTATVGSYKIRAVGNQWFDVVNTLNQTAITSPESILSTSNISFFPIQLGGSAPTVNQIISAINTNVIYGAIVQGTATADAGDPSGTTAGTGTITTSSVDENVTGNANVRAYQFFDGVNWISSDNLGVIPNTFLLKNSVTTILTSGLGNNLDNNFNAEKFRLTPIITSSIVNYLNSPATSGLFTNSDLLATSDGTKVSISSLTAGSLGSVQVTGGTANSAIAPIIGSSVLINSNTNILSTISAPLSTGFAGSQWVQLTASSSKPKLTGWTASTNVTITPGPTAVFWLGTYNRGITDGLIGTSATYPVNQISLAVISGTTTININLLVIGNAPTIWAAQPVIGDIITIPSSSVLYSAGANGGNWLVVSSTSSTITCTPLQGQTPVSIGPSYFTNNPPGNTDIYDSTSIYVPPGSALVTINSGGNAGTMPNSITAPINSVNLEWQIEKHGNFFAYIPTGNGALPTSGLAFPSNLIPANNDTVLNTGEGGWVHINCGGFSPSNQGFFQVVRTENDSYIPIGSNNFPVQGFWIQNSGGVKEIVQQTSLSTLQLPSDFINFYSYDSIIPGDVFAINTATFGGIQNQGTWNVSNIVEGQGMGQTYNKFIISGAGITNFKPFTGNLSSNLGYIQVLPQNPLTLFKRIVTIGPDAGNLTGLSDVIFDTPNLASRITSTNGFVMTAQDKLNFLTTLTLGQDAYKVATGIISEANKVVYGVAQDPITYPGISSSGTNINIQGPIVKRIQLSVAVRLQANANVDETTILNNVQSAIASVVNNVGVGGQLALGAIIAAAQGVNGVISAVMLSPVLTSANDLIPIQPFEKPLILNINSDVLVTTL